MGVKKELFDKYVQMVYDEEQLPLKAPNVWRVFGLGGGIFSSLAEAKRSAREASQYEDNNYRASVYRCNDGGYYIDYENGSCVRDGWTIKRKSTV